jgi:hypothetical protein
VGLLYYVLLTAAALGLTAGVGFGLVAAATSSKGKSGSPEGDGCGSYGNDDTNVLIHDLTSERMCPVNGLSFYEQ